MRGSDELNFEVPLGIFSRAPQIFSEFFGVPLQFFDKIISRLRNFSQVLPKIILKISQNFHQNVFKFV